MWRTYPGYAGFSARPSTVHGTVGCFGVHCAIRHTNYPTTPSFICRASRPLFLSVTAGGLNHRLGGPPPVQTHRVTHGGPGAFALAARIVHAGEVKPASPVVRGVFNGKRKFLELLCGSGLVHPPRGLRGRVSSGSLPAAASSSASFWMRAPKIISRTNAHAPTAGNSSSPTPRTVPAILPETISITPRCAVKSRYNPSSATVRAAKVFPLPPASTTMNTPLKSNTPSMKARAPNGTGSNNTVAAKRMQASALQSRNDKKK